MNFVRTHAYTLGTIIAWAIVGIISYSLNIADSYFITATGLIITVYFGIVRISLDRDRIFKELFKEFNERYNHSFNDFLNNLRSRPDIKLDLDERNIVVDYLNLCAEEYLWRKRNRIPNDVWKAWLAGIQENMHIPQVKEVFMEEGRTVKARMSYYGLFEEIERIQ